MSDEEYKPSPNMQRLMKAVVLVFPHSGQKITFENLIDEWACEFAMGNYDEVIKRLDDELRDIIFDERRELFQ